MFLLKLSCRLLLCLSWKQNVDVIIHLGDYIYEYGVMRQKMLQS